MTDATLTARLAEGHRVLEPAHAQAERTTTTSDQDRAVRYPALTAWRRRLRSGRIGELAARPSTWVLDGLWRAACWEAAAEEAERAGQRDSWRHAMQRAREVMAEAGATL